MSAQVIAIGHDKTHQTDHRLVRYEAMCLAIAECHRVDLISSAEFARKLGYDNSVPSTWIARGLLKTKRELMNANSVSIKDSYCWISRKAARHFLVNHPAAYDHRRITDWLWVLDLLTNQAVGAEAVSDTCGKGDTPEFSISEAA